MKRTIYLGVIALATLTVSSCSNDESVFNEANEAQKSIGFDTYATRPNQSRGLATDDNALKGSNNGTDAGFGIFAYKTDATAWASAKASAMPAFMTNIHVMSNSNNWEYAPVRYWDGGKKISFFAYAPFGNNKISELPSSSTTGAPSFVYTSSTSGAEMIDIVTAQQIDKTSGTVELTFNHILSRIGLQVKEKSAITNTKINVTDVTMNVKASSGLISAATYTFADTDEGKGSWVKKTDWSAGSITLPGKFNGSAASGTTGYTENGILLSSSAQAIQKADGTNDPYMYFIPTTLTGSNIEFTFTYDIVTSPNGSSDWAVAQSAVTKTVNLGSSLTAIEQGKAYNLIFSIGLDAITFTASVSSWDVTPGDTTIE